MELIECCKLLENLELIPVNIMDTPEKVEDFCEKYSIHSSQTLFNNNKIQEIFSQIDDYEFIHVSDSLKIHFLFAYCNDTPIIYGPYCTKLLSNNEISILLSSLKATDIDTATVARQRSRYTVKPQQNAQYYLNILISEVTGDSTVHVVKNIDLSPLARNKYDEQPSKDIAIKLVREHYANEQKLINSISEGNYTKAIETWHFLHNAVSYNNIGHTMEVARISAGITRTMLRIGASNAGLPAEINDYISGKSSQFMIHARSIDAIYMEHERLIKEYCDVISEFKNKNYSHLVLSIKYFIENEYDKPLSLEDIANDVSCSVSNLVHQFKRETGTTPIAYLNHIRMKAASDALTHTNDSIQDIASSVGILDSNYFVKCFKKEYDMTPSAYRSKFRNGPWGRG